MPIKPLTNAERQRAWRRRNKPAHAEYQRAWRKERRDLIATLQQTIALRDQEIARLKAKVNRLLRRLRS